MKRRDIEMNETKRKSERKREEKKHIDEQR